MSAGAPHVLYLCLDPHIALEPGAGASVHVTSMIAAMERLGLRVSRLSINDLQVPGPSRLERRLAARRRVRTWSRPLRRAHLEGPRVLRALRSSIASGSYAAVYERSSMLFGVGAQAAREAGLLHVLEVNTPMARESTRFRQERLRAILQRQERQGWMAADRVCAVSRDLEREVRAAGQRDVAHVPNAVEHDLFHPGVEPDAWLRGEVGSALAVAFSGTLKPWHDLPTVIDGFAAARLSRPRVLVLIGAGPESSAVAERAERAGIRVVSTGSVPHGRVPALLAAVDVCVAPLSADPDFHYFSPLKAMEYLAMGKPTLVAAAGDLSDLVEAGAALGYRPGSDTDFAAALGRLAAQPELERAVSAAGVRVAAGSSWDDNARRSFAGLVAGRPS